MVAYATDFQIEPLVEGLAAEREVDLRELSRERFDAQVGELQIEVRNAKRPHGPWDPELHDLVMASRHSYWETWGHIPLEDGLDEFAYVDVAWVTHPPSGRRANGAVGAYRTVEGLTVRTVYIDQEGTHEQTRWPDDLRFWIGPRGVPLFDLMATGLYGGDKHLARRKLVIGSRLASFRPAGARHNLYTPEAYAALQVVAASRAIQDGVDYFVNTMREEMTQAVLSLPDGWQYEHFRTEHRLGLPLGSIHLNRVDPFVFEHMCNYPGYFTNTRDFVALIERLLSEQAPGFENALRGTGIEHDKLASLKASQLKIFSRLLDRTSVLTAGFSAGDLRQRIRDEVGDGPRSFTTQVRERLAQGIRLLEHSPAGRRVQGGTG